MKIACIALLAVGAFAVQDTTPPVISLNLKGMAHTDDWVDTHNKAPFNISYAHSAGTECTRLSSTVQCPDPQCEVHDHHDKGLTCNTPSEQRVRAEPNTVKLTPAGVGAASVNRNQLGQFLVRYTAEDGAGNQADPVTFSFLFVDPFVPHFESFDQTEANKGYTRFDVPGYPYQLFQGNLNTNSIKMTPKPSSACTKDNIHECQTKKFVRVCNVDTAHDAKAAKSCRKIDNTKDNLNKVQPCKISKFSVKTGDEYDCSVRNMVVDTSYALTMGEQSYWRYGSADTPTAGYIPRTDKTSWAYNFGVSVTDPMHATDDVQYYSDEALTAWYKVNGEASWHKTDNATPDKINTLRTGYQTIDYYVEDGAGSYGFGQTNNINFHRVELEFYDHIKPRIYLGCYKNDNRPNWPTHDARQYRAAGDEADPTPFAGHCVTTLDSRDLCGSGQCSFTPEGQQDVTLECVGTHASAGTVLDSYVEPGMTILDNVDSWDGDTIKPIEYSSLDTPADSLYSITPSSPVTTFSQTVSSGQNTVVYKAADAHENDAASLTRAVTTVDRYAPILKLVGDLKVQNSAGAAKNHLQDGQENAPSTWENSADGLFNHNAFGINAGTSGSATSKGYSCTDQCNKEEDLTISIRLFQDSTCNTDRNGVSNTAKEITGAGDNDWEFPEYVTGSYAILYKCTDKSGNYALECRDVENVDHTRPIIQILGSDDMTLEATHQGNYIDDGATCSDQVDGVISQNVEVSGDVVNLSKVGEYKIQYNCKDNADRSAVTAERIVKVEQTSCPTCTVTGCTAATGCMQYHEASFAYLDAGATCSDVIDGDITPQCIKCTGDNCDAGESAGTPISCQDSDLINAKATGTYYITYVAQNTVNKWNWNSDCRGNPFHYVRTVIVQDTLKPVITLRYGSDNKVVAQGEVSQTSEALTTTAGDNQKTDGTTATNTKFHGAGFHHSNTANAPLREKDGVAVPFSPMAHNTGNLMAEETSTGVNGWVLGAIASAVTGLALLGYSQRKTTVATSVPV